MRFRQLKLRKDPDCPVCGTHPTVRELIDYDEFCGVLPVADPLPTASDRDITVEELKRKMDAKESRLFVLDVREPQEFQICSIAGATLIPLGEVPRRVGELDQTREIVVQCKSGIRSAKAAEFLRSSGFTNVKNLTGGILAWIDRVDPTLPKY
jgi:adenylyltransferase/sulfurtransferase